LADMPFVLSSTLATLKDSLESSGDLPRIVIPQCYDRTGNPVGLSQCFGAELRRLSGDVGARSIVQRNAEAKLIISVMDEGIFHDIDVPGDLAKG